MMTAPDLALYIRLTIATPAFLLAVYVFVDAYLFWRNLVRKGSNGARHRVAENAMIIAGALLGALALIALQGAAMLYPTSGDYAQWVQIGTRLYTSVTVIFILAALIRSVTLIKEIVIILDNVATDEGLDLPSLQPRPMATINSLPIKRDAAVDVAAMPTVTAPVAVVLPPDQAGAGSPDLTDAPVVTAPVIVVTPPEGSVVDRANKKGK